jgi:hypothetical protein
MNLLFERIQSGSHPRLQGLMPLYFDSFPPEERRTSAELLRMLNVSEMYFSAITEEDQVIGLVVYWKFDRFHYLEHIALFPEQRRKGFGLGVLKQLQKEGKPLLLEAEIPYDAESTGRVTFYNRSGFSALPVYYHQPPYRKGEEVVPMMLFSDKTDWDSEELDKSIRLFHHKVYGA